ncbi:MAG: DUF3667 domain-containing protein [Chitinophagales bacterium]
MKCICLNCETEFEGNFCSNCGEKVITDKDFSLFQLLGKMFNNLLNFDSKTLRTLYFFALRPGHLTVSYIKGIRKPYISPFQIFVLTNIFFFLFLSEIDILRTPAKWYFMAENNNGSVLQTVNEMAAIRDITKAEVAVLYDKQSNFLSKSLLFLLLPFVAGFVALLNFRKRILLGKHFIFAVHYFSFMLLMSSFCFIFLELLPFQTSKYYFIIPVTVLQLLYFSVAHKKVYQDTWPLTIFKSCIAIFLINFIIQVYRGLIDALSLATI